MSYTIRHIANVIGAEATVLQDAVIEHLLLDSRKIYAPASSVFFALKGPRRDGHQFIGELYNRGIRNFVVSLPQQTENYPEANFLVVHDTLEALQLLTSFHRKQFSIPVIGITGSNGKTIVKEWLYQLLHFDYNIVRSPRSYNSQIGVPLSVWQMNAQHTMGIFEAGISRPGEMENLERIIQPTIGVLTNIGEAHSEGFLSKEHKELEKRKLFTKAQVPAALHIIAVEKSVAGTLIKAFYDTKDNTAISIQIPFTDDASIQNAITCWQVLLLLKVPQEIIQQRMKNLTPVNMRLEMKKGINHCTIINDSYSADISSLEIALNFLEQQAAGHKRTVILSDLLQSATPATILYEQVQLILKKHHINRIIGVGPAITEYLGRLTKEDSELESFFYSGTDEFIHHFRSSHFRDEVILIKGARLFAFESIAQLLEQKVHQTVLEINLTSIIHNLKEYQHCLKPNTKVMAMVKAFAYGSGGAEIAGILQYHKVDYLGVAYADEGVELRKAGISLPIMVMNPEESAFSAIVNDNLQPEIYSFELLRSFDQFLQNEGLQQYPVHIEIETGMNRLGFAADEAEQLADYLLSSPSFRVESVFSHLAASEEKSQDEFTMKQFATFNRATQVLERKLRYPVLKHIANSAAAIRHPDLQLGMVRLGIGLYGVDSAATGLLKLQTVATLKSTVAQLKHLKKGDSVSYNRKYLAEKDTLIATIRIGYADGYPRRLGYGVGKVSVRGKLAPVTGTVCMDMFMVDVTEVPGVEVGDDVIIFGAPLPVQTVAEWAGTIPYEIMTGISQRVKRVYFEE
ncbi:MAG TPA: alanine racemase [Chitinophagaceae bacterium]|nr:alanine racemase [Chitinophagaceae bacterium]